MQRILIIGRGEIATRFVRTIRERYADAHLYDIVGLGSESEGATIRIFDFDPTSLFRLAPLLKNDYRSAYLIWDRLDEAQVILGHLRRESPDLAITMVDFWGIDLNDGQVNLVPVVDLVTARLVDFLPSIPVVAQNIGLGQGEIMEVMVPADSPYAYRNLSNIQQKNWRIVALYRNRQLVLVKPSTMIRPGDTLLLVGAAHILQDIYRLIKSQTGHFPQPFGQHLYLYLDMLDASDSKLTSLVNESLWLAKHLKRKLYIRVANALFSPLYDRLRQMRDEEATLLWEYRGLDFGEVVGDDVVRYGVGLVIVGRERLTKSGVMEALWNLRRPVLKIGRQTLATLSQMSLILTSKPTLEKIAPTLFDISSQTNLPLVLYNFDPENEPKTHVIEHYEHLARIHNSRIEIKSGQKNPIRELQKLFNVLHCLPFEHTMTKRRMSDLFALDPERLFWKLDETTQLLIPAEE
ncbi:MAG: hypothetical protein K6347_01385 [Campylobacterales bacterium]